MDRLGSPEKWGLWGIWGSSGTGKGTYARELIANRKRIVVVDNVGDFARQKGFVEVSGMIELRKHILKSPGKFRLAIVPLAGSEAETLNRVSDLLLIVQDGYKTGRHRAGVTLVCDEMAYSFPLNSGPKNAPHFAQICSFGRHYGISVVGISQRVVEVDNRFRGNLSNSVCFRCSGKADRERSADMMGVSKEQIASLVNFQYLRYEESSGLVTEGTTKKG